MYAALEALELPSSPPRTRKGFPSTTSWRVSPCFSNRAGAATQVKETATASRAPNNIADFVMPRC
jgi:hypothetical protein